MRTILFLIQKEFIQIFRNRTMLPIIFVAPIIQLIVLVNAATLELKHINMYVVDKDLSTTSRAIVNQFNASPFFKVQSQSFSLQDAESALLKDKADVVLHIPANFEKQLVRNNKANVQVLVNAINGMTAGIANAYITQIISGYNQQVRTDFQQVTNGEGMAVQPKNIAITSQFWYNPELKYTIFMVPAVLVLLVTIMGMILPALNLVREKELGTIEQINVTPIHKYQFIAAKLIPFLIIALVVLSFGLFFGKLLFHIPIVGNLGLVYLVAFFYLITVLGIGLFISTLADTQQQTMFVAFFFMLVFIMMSGVFTPTESMPDWAQKVNIINPIAYFVRAIRMILLKGSGLGNVMHEIISLAIYGTLILSFAVMRYKKIS
jgi:ABC-2 type transport system permease protein